MCVTKCTKCNSYCYNQSLKASLEIWRALPHFFYGEKKMETRKNHLIFEKKNTLSEIYGNFIGKWQTTHMFLTYILFFFLPRPTLLHCQRASVRRRKKTSEQFNSEVKSTRMSLLGTTKYYIHSCVPVSGICIYLLAIV